jgi:hypothetical protein
MVISKEVSLAKQKELGGTKQKKLSEIPTQLFLFILE